MTTDGRFIHIVRCDLRRDAVVGERWNRRRKVLVHILNGNSGCTTWSFSALAPEHRHPCVRVNPKFDGAPHPSA